MPGRFVRSQAAERVAELLGSREGRKYLTGYGWVEGMPIVITHPKELLNDVMGLVSLHDRPVLVAMFDAVVNEVHLIHVSLPLSTLQLVDEVTPRARIDELFEQAKTAGRVTFRAKYWRHSAVAHPIPAVSMDQLLATEKQKLTAA